MYVLYGRWQGNEDNPTNLYILQSISLSSIQLFKSSLTLFKAYPVGSGYDGWDGYCGAGVSDKIIIMYNVPVQKRKIN